MPKIEIDSTHAGPDKAVARQRAVNDLLYIETSNMYINQKKQLQELIYKLYKLDFYIDRETFLNV